MKCSVHLAHNNAPLKTLTLQSPDTQAGRSVRFGAVGADAGSLGGEEDASHLEDPDTHHNNMIPTASRHIGAQGSRMLSALFEGLGVDFFSLVSSAGLLYMSRV